MKHDYYADEKDAAKWTVAIAEKGGHRGGVIQVAMMPDLPIPQPPYHFDPMPQGTDEHVAQFFANERQTMTQGAVLRDAGRIVGLGANTTFLNPTGFYSWELRNEYFIQVTNHLRQRRADRRDVVLLDPCTGLSSFCQVPTQTHLDPISVRIVWDALRPADVLMVFQYQLQGQYAGNWQHLTSGVLAGVLGQHVAMVRNCGLNNAVRFFCVTKHGG